MSPHCSRIGEARLSTSAWGTTFPRLSRAAGFAICAFCSKMRVRLFFAPGTAHKNINTRKDVLDQKGCHPILALIGH